MRRPFPRPPWGLLIAALLAGCAGGSAPEGTDPAGSAGAPVSPVRSGVTDVVATVGGAPIGADDLRTEASRRPADGDGPDRQAVLDDLITQEILFQESLKKGLHHDTKVRKILVNLLLRQEVYATVDNQDFTDAELERYYTEHKADFIVPEKVQVKRITLRVSPTRDEAATKALADQLYAEVRRDPRQFSEVAARASEGPFQRRGGDLGFLSAEGKPGVEPEVVAKAFTMKVDEIHPPVLVADAWHILYVTNRRERVERSFQQMKGSVLRMVKQERFKALTDTYIAEARKRYDVDIDKARLDAVELTRGGSRSPTVDNLGPAGVEDDAAPELE